MADAVAAAPAVVPTTAAPATSGTALAKTEAAVPQVFKVKVNGQQREYSQAEAERLLSKSAFADDVMRQGREAVKTLTQVKAEREAEKARAKSDTDAWMREHGIDPDDFAHRRVSKRLAEHEMTPEQRAIAERDARIAELQKKADEAEADKRKGIVSEAAKRIQARVTSVLGDAWERAGFEKGSDSFSAVHDVMREWRDIGLLPKTPEEFTPALADRIIEAAKDSIEGSFKRLESAALKGLDGEALEQRLGKPVVDKLLRHMANKIRGGGMKPQTQVAAKPADSGSGYMTVHEHQAEMRRRAGVK